MSQGDTKYRASGAVHHLSLCCSRFDTTQKFGPNSTFFSNLLDDTPEIQSQVRKDHLRCVSPWRHRDAGTGVTAGTAQIHIGDGRFVFAERGDGAQ